MTTKHTPGPWVVACQATVANADETMVVANVSSWSLEAEQVQANTRLIAAAPELLEALEMVACWRGLLASLPPFPAQAAVLEDLDDARAVITKATI